MTQLFKIKKLELSKKINDYIDSQDDKKEFNKVLKQIFSINETIELLSIKFAISALLKYENEYSRLTKTNGKIISNIIYAIDAKTGKEIYDYSFVTFDSDNGKEMSLQIDIKRKDKEQNHYSYMIYEIFEKFSENIENVDEMLYLYITELIDLCYKYAEDYIEYITTNDKQFNEERFLKEIVYIIADTGANEIYSLIKNGSN